MHMQKRGVLAAAITAVISAIAGTAQANSIGIQFSGAGTSLPAAQTAGVVSAANWNIESANFGTGVTGLVDSTSAAVSGLSLTYSSNYNVPGNNGGSADPGFSDLFSNHLESPYAAPSTGSVPNNRVTAYLTNIPYATYDIYVYTSNEGRKAAIYQGTSNASVGSNEFDYTDTAAATYVAGDNYVLISGLSGPTQFLVDSLSTAQGGNTGGAGLNAGIGGIQIVDTSAVPEPASLSLLGIGGVALLARRRRRLA